MSATYHCSNGHMFTAQRPPQHCPYCVQGRPCTGVVGTPVRKQRA